jgi:hypothetical protein
LDREKNNRGTFCRALNFIIEKNPPTESCGEKIIKKRNK